MSNGRGERLVILILHSHSRSFLLSFLYVYALLSIASVTATIDEAVKSDGVTLFVIAVNITGKSDTVDVEDSWTVNRRYSEFDAFYRQIVHDIKVFKMSCCGVVCYAAVQCGAQCIAHTN